MTLLSVVQDVCAAVGVDRPTSVFSNINYNRTMAEMLALANEMAQRIALDGYDWTGLQVDGQFIGDGVTEEFRFPVNFQRLLLNSQMWRSTSTLYPMRFISDRNEWQQRRLRGYSDPRGEWTVRGIFIEFAPLLAAHTSAPWRNSVNYNVDALALDTTVTPNAVWQTAVAHTSAASGTFASDRSTHPSFWTSPVQTIDAVKVAYTYLDRNSIIPAGTTFPEAGEMFEFHNDNDGYWIDERLLKLGMIWQWKANKGSPYAEDLNSYNDALALLVGKDKPAPIIVGRLPISAAARVGYPFPIAPGMVPL